MDTKLPFQDLSSLDPKNMLASLSPFIKIAGEWFPNRDISMLSGGPVAKFEGEDARGVFEGLLSRETEAKMETALPLFGRLNRIASAQSKNKQGALAFLNQLSPFSFTPVDVPAVQRGRIYKAREIIRLNKQKAKNPEEREQGRTNVSGRGGQSLGKTLGF
jgi:hypothetical protein